jgi:hypothetical protein
MTTPAPNLWDAYAAARRAQEKAQHAAALHLVPKGARTSGGRYILIGPHMEMAVDAAEAAKAARYESKALLAAARGEVDR